jgi:hypothetical protein
MTAGYSLTQLRLKNKTLLPFSRSLETVEEIRLGSCCESGVLDCSSAVVPKATASTVISPVAIPS